MTLVIPPSKLRDIRREASRILHRSTTTLRQLSSFIGKAQTTTLAVLLARLQTGHLITARNLALRRDTVGKGVRHLNHSQLAKCIMVPTPSPLHLSPPTFYPTPVCATGPRKFQRRSSTKPPLAHNSMGYRPA
ncbi:hypothetical protein PHYBLDRAFT_168705 [Phycomyces blakesleeanus NRRL 1555(-)]|uniref:Uncharacterized protein n=1 Tax=Phycomyces blakesleeanus (strain ATCC 8743b / DSM 1359 / FGSC 10004 / NBRC 33097 / NRRL 1555) TaxID=763407 RepID=A0A162NDL5_PHYB8|nr:hypothetical protein PHYBLDRAFT_168705 [Phycomyces blakesleeanus NRRL 1555(-)]OAD73348.1 hypothetical protein PHYBLDRAFT_168705 [Phycomyces blakesleeanus NRRL 1555(-)]|eukprot:XP_018291388.1 hypothetical protein PHYBLDRAFT_168705 [Phycomyces blakesleeanus NRRL 1555(-)]